jgi:NAD(P)-dependent dehydrogenase (short-subunit alcohol dehydrogenase family)
VQKTILITGATDGIGLETAKLLAKDGHTLLLHGRSPDKLENVNSELSKITTIEKFIADLSDLSQVNSLVISILDYIKSNNSTLDILINNAGILKTPNPVTKDGLDIRFVVNTIAPYILTKGLLPILDTNSRVINLSSAAQAPVDLDALSGKDDAAKNMNEMDAYSQSKLAITMWTRYLAAELGGSGPSIIAVNPGSLLGSKMVKDEFGIEGKDLSIGAQILVKAALSDEFNNASGMYFDNDVGDFNNPHIDALDINNCKSLVGTIESIIN